LSELEGQEEYHHRVETLREMGSDIRRDKGAEEPLYVLFKCSTLGTAHYLSVKTFKRSSIEALGHM